MVELLTTIVIIGILAGITAVSYRGLTQRAVELSLKSDLSNASEQLKIFNIRNRQYPTTISTDCVAAPTSTTNLCLKVSPGNSYSTIAYANPTPQSFVLTGVNGNNTIHITESLTPTIGVYVAPSLATTDPANWLAIGTQVWAKYNLNVGTMVPGTLGGNNATNQTVGVGIEKYCYQNNPAHCATYGGLYQWDEAMNYATAEKAQGICPAGSHIPSDNEWKILEMYLGMTQLQADATGWRGTNLEGTKLKSGGSSGLNVPLAGYRLSDGSYFDLSSFATLWSSSESGVGALDRHLYTSQADVNRFVNVKGSGFLVRCVGN